MWGCKRNSQPVSRLRRFPNGSLPPSGEGAPAALRKEPSEGRLDPSRQDGSICKWVNFRNRPEKWVNFLTHLTQMGPFRETLVLSAVVTQGDWLLRHVSSRISPRKRRQDKISALGCGGRRAWYGAGRSSPFLLPSLSPPPFLALDLVTIVISTGYRSSYIYVALCCC